MFAPKERLDMRSRPRPSKPAIEGDRLRRRLERSPHRQRVVVVGSSNTDLVLTCERLPRPGETILGGDFARLPGGKGANQAVAAVRAGARVAFIGARGDDVFGTAARRALAAEGIDVRSFLGRADAPSGVALILVGGKDRQNLIGVARSANDTLTARDVERAASRLHRVAVVLAQLEVPLSAVRAAAALARSRGVPLVLNPAPARPLEASLLRLVHTLTPNEHEARVLTGAKNPEKAALALRRRGAANVVVTLGDRGALVATANGVTPVRAPRVRAVDTVGAGDCFSAWYAVGLAEGLDVVAAAARAVRAASLSVTRRGAQPAMPYRDEVMSFQPL
jgi:ribokinase